MLLSFFCRARFRGFILISLFALLAISTATQARDWIYTVKPGDTLWELCLVYTDKKNCWLELGPYNGVTFPPSLAPGTRIKFPVAWLKAKPVPALLSYVRGEVQLANEAGVWQVATQGAQLVMGNRVKTGANSTATLTFADGSMLVLESDSEAVLDTLTRHSHTGMVDSRLNLFSGAANSRVKKREPANRFEVNTPSAIAAVRGTEFRVTAQKESMLGEVFEGLVEIANTARQTRDLPAGFGIRVIPKQPLSEPVALLPEITWEKTAPLVTLPHSVSWQALKGANAYKIELLPDDETEQVLFAGRSAQPTFALPANSPKCVRVRVSGIDSQGLQGMPTQQHLCVSHAPESPTLTLTNRSELRWDSVANAASYRIERSAAGDFSDARILAETDALHFAVPSGSGNHSLRVLAVNSDGIAGEPSNTVQPEPSGWWQFVVSMLGYAVLIAL